MMLAILGADVMKVLRALAQRVGDYDATATNGGSASTDRCPRAVRFRLAAYLPETKRVR